MPFLPPNQQRQNTPLASPAMTDKASTWQITNNAPSHQQLLTDEAGGWSTVASSGWRSCCSMANDTRLRNAHNNNSTSLRIHCTCLTKWLKTWSSALSRSSWLRGVGHLVGHVQRALRMLHSNRVLTSKCTCRWFILLSKCPKATGLCLLNSAATKTETSTLLWTFAVCQVILYSQFL